MTSRFDNLEFDDHEPPRKEGAPAGRDPRGWASGGDGASDTPFPPPGSTGTPVRDADYFITEGDNQFRLNNLEAALRAYSRALEQDNALFSGWFGQVRVLLENGEYKEADLWADKALELFPNQPELLAVKAVASTRMGKRSIALAQSDNAIARAGATPFVWLARAEVLLASRRRMADHCIDKALVISTGPRTRAWTHWEIACLLRRYNRLAQAARHVTEAAELLPGEAAVWLELARCQLALGQRAARQSLQQVIALTDECVTANRLLREYREPGFLRRLFRFGRK